MRWLLLLTSLLLGACAWRVEAPVPPAGGVRLELIDRGCRLPAAPQQVRQALARALVAELGWRLDAAAPAVLRLELSPETIVAAGSLDRVTSRWTITLDARIELLDHGPSRQARLSASGGYGGLDDEILGVEAAAQALADAVVAWLMGG